MSDNEKIIAAVNEWQNNERLHPLTCGKDSNHQPLKPEERGGRVVLVCLDCDYVQTYIPQICTQ